MEQQLKYTFRNNGLGENNDDVFDQILISQIMNIFF